jgi:DNA replication protein DnaC
VGLQVRFFTAADLVGRLEKAQKQYTLDRFLGQLERAHLLICDELGYVSLSQGGVELLFCPASPENGMSRRLGYNQPYRR